MAAAEQAEAGEVAAVAAEPQTTAGASFCRPKEMAGQRPGRAASSCPEGARGHGRGAANHAATLAAVGRLRTSTTGAKLCDPFKSNDATGDGVGGVCVAAAADWSCAAKLGAMAAQPQNTR